MGGRPLHRPDPGAGFLRKITDTAAGSCKAPGFFAQNGCGSAAYSHCGRVLNPPLRFLRKYLLYFSQNLSSGLVGAASLGGPPYSRQSFLKRRTGRRPRRPTSCATISPYRLFPQTHNSPVRAGHPAGPPNEFPHRLPIKVAASPRIEFFGPPREAAPTTYRKAYL